jgi:hypothetical protein
VTCPLVPVRFAMLGKRAGLAMTGGAKRAKFIFFLGKGVIEKILLFVNDKLDPYPDTFGLKKGVLIWKEEMTAIL